MQRTDKRMLCNCFSKGDLTFVIDGKQEIGLGSVDFVLTQEITKDGEGPTPGYHAVQGIFYTKDAETATKLLQQLDNAEIRERSAGCSKIETRAEREKSRLRVCSFRV
jgi:hypothetical protein